MHDSVSNRLRPVLVQIAESLIDLRLGPDVILHHVDDGTFVGVQVLVWLRSQRVRHRGLAEVRDARRIIVQ
jgi:hypothetical protein